MATSGSTVFSMTRDEIIHAAVRKLGALAEGQVLSPVQLSNAAQALNAMVKSFASEGMPLWAIKEQTIPLTDTSSYNIGIGSAINIPAPLKVIQATLIDLEGTWVSPLNIITHYDYNSLSRGGEAPPVSIWYEPLNQVGILHVWPHPDSGSISTRQIKLVYQRPFEDFVSGEDAVDFPQNWLEALIYGLAWRLSPEYGTPLNDRKTVAQEAEGFKAVALAFGTEEGSLFLYPEWWR